MSRIVIVDLAVKDIDWGTYCSPLLSLKNQPLPQLIEPFWCFLISDSAFVESTTSDEVSFNLVSP